MGNYSQKRLINSKIIGYSDPYVKKTTGLLHYLLSTETVLLSCFLGACVIASQIVSGGTYDEKVPTLATDTNNITHDIARFYKVDNQQFSMSGYFILDSDTRIDLNYDNGLKSQKRIRSKALTVGVTQLAFIDSDSHITYGVSTKLGGKTTEIPCTDDSGMDKQFFCDNLSTLQPFKQPEYNRNTKVSINYQHKFNWPNKLQ